MSWEELAGQLEALLPGWASPCTDLEAAKQLQAKAADLCKAACAAPGIVHSEETKALLHRQASWLQAAAPL